MSSHVAQRRVYDCFLYNGETDVLEIRLHELSDVVHRFILVESNTTFSGLPKVPSFDPTDPRIVPFSARIGHVVVTDMPDTEDAWVREAWQRNAVLRGLPDAAGDDLVLMSDVDEIPRATAVKELASDTAKKTSACGLPSTTFLSITGKSRDPRQQLPGPSRQQDMNSIMLRQTLSGSR